MVAQSERIQQIKHIQENIDYEAQQVLDVLHQQPVPTLEPSAPEQQVPQPTMRPHQQQLFGQPDPGPFIHGVQQQIRPASRVTENVRVEAPKAPPPYGGTAVEDVDAWLYSRQLFFAASPHIPEQQKS